MTAPDPVVSCRRLRKVFGPVVALDGVDFSVARGRVHGLVGPNGAGKTTLLRILFGLITPTAGTVTVLGATPGTGRGRSLAGVAGFVETPTFPPYLPARRALRLLAELDGGAAPDRVGPAIEAVGLAAAAGRKVARLSTGQRQRLGLAAALIRDPQLLVIDEPTTGLDPGGITDLHDLVRDLAAGGRTVLLSSHDMTEVDTLCDDVSVLAAGRVAHTGSLADLRATATTATSLLRTSDDPQARVVAGRTLPRGAVEVREDGSLAVTAAPAALDTFVLALAAAGVAVRELVRTESALQTEYRRLVG